MRSKIQVVKALATGGRVELGDVRHVEGPEFEADDR